jgi:hypothetical protein
MENLRINWDVLWNAIVFFALLVQARWVWKDAQHKYGRGRFWGVVAFFFPVGGLVFYLLYRGSALMEIDMTDAELEYDCDLASNVQVSRRFSDRPKKHEGWALRRTRYVRVSKRDKFHAKELRQKAESVENENPLLAKELREKADSIDPPKQKRKSLKGAWREFWTIKRDEFYIGLRKRRARKEYLRTPKKLRRYEEFIEKLSTTPFVDPTIEGLIFEGQYEVARERAIVNLEIAEETDNERKRITYRRYLNQIDKITHVYFPKDVSDDDSVLKYDLSQGNPAHSNSLDSEN